MWFELTRTSKLVWLTGVFVVSLTVYLATLAPSLYVEDSAELAAAAVTLGIPHPPGYPTWVLLGKLFSLVPFGELAWRVNALSAVAGAAAVVLMYLVALKLTSQRFIASAAAFTFAVSRTFWLQAVAAEVYTLYAAFALVALYLILCWRDTRQKQLIVILGFMVGIGSGAHQLMLFLALAIVAAGVVAGWRPRSWSQVVFPAVAFLVGAAVYLYLPLRSLANPALDWGNPETMANFWAHVSRAQYADVAALANFNGKLSLVGSFFNSLPAEVSWVACALAALGFVVSWRDRFVGVLLTSVLASQVLLPVFVRQYGWGVGVEYNYRAYFVVAYAVVVLYAALGARYGWNWVCCRAAVGWYLPTRLVGASLAVLVPLLPMVRHWSIVDVRRHQFTESFGRALLTSLPPRAVFVSKVEGLGGDTELFVLAYLKYVEQLRPDVLVVDDVGIFVSPPDFPATDQDYRSSSFSEQRRELMVRAIGYARNHERPLATTFPFEGIPELGVVSRATGASFLMFDSEQAARAARITASLPVAVPPQVPPERYGEQDAVAHYLYLRAAYAEEQGNGAAAQADVVRAIAYDNELVSTSYRDYVAHRAWWLNRR